jgi:phage major head subunit gpT-like protein
MTTPLSMQPVDGRRLSDGATRKGNKIRRHGARGGYQLASAPPGGKSLNADKAEAAYVGYHKTFNDRLAIAPSIYPRLTTLVQTDNIVDVQLWLSQNPVMRPWIGEKVLSKYRVESHQIVTKPHEASVEVPKKDIDMDRFGLYRPRIDSLADTYPRALDRLSIAMLVAGVQGTALGSTYDGQNLIDTDHTVSATGGTAQSNKVTGPLSETVYESAQLRLLGLKNENGEPINQGKRTTLVVGPANRKVARQILEADDVPTNLNQGSSDLIVTPWLAPGDLTVYGPNGPTTITLTGNEWFLLVDGSSAVIIHEKQGPEFLSVEEGEFVFMKGIYLYGVEAEFGAGYGLWQEVVGGPGA